MIIFFVVLFQYPLYFLGSLEVLPFWLAGLWLFEILSELVIFSRS